MNHSIKGQFAIASSDHHDDKEQRPLVRSNQSALGLFRRRGHHHRGTPHDAEEEPAPPPQRRRLLSPRTLRRSPKPRQNEEDAKRQPPSPAAWDENSKMTILCEIIGASQLSREYVVTNHGTNHDSSTTTKTTVPCNADIIEPYCVVQFGNPKQQNGHDDKTTMIHRTKRAKIGGLNPIWTISTGSLFLLRDVTIHDMVHNDMIISVYYKREDTLMITTLQTVCLGKAYINCYDTILPHLLYEERVDVPIRDEQYHHYRVSTSRHHSSAISNDPIVGDDHKGTLTCRFRLATPSDIQFLRLLHNEPALLSHKHHHHHNNMVSPQTTNNHNLHQQQQAEDNNKRLSSSSSDFPLQESSRFLQLWDDPSPEKPPASDAKKNNHKKNLLVTEQNETEKVGESFLQVLSSAFTSKVMRDPKTGCLKSLVKPYPDPDRISETTYMTKHDMKYEALLPSKEWIYAGSGHDVSCGGRVYVEILSCHNLPNVDIGEAVGNYTDCFICAVLEDAVVQTDVINDELDPLWLPWTQRAFIFGMKHPSSHLYIAAFDYDLGVMNPHEPIGRIAINLSHFQSHTDYTLKYHLYPSSNVTDRIAAGSITIRLRLEYNNEKESLLSASPLATATTMTRERTKYRHHHHSNMKFHVNVHKEKTLAVVRYTCFGSYGDDSSDQKFDMTVARSYINEIFEYKAAIVDSIGDAFRSLILWRGQVQVFHTNVYIPLHSFFFFCAMTILIERPYLLPSFLCISVGWILIATQTVRRQHPSPWYRCPSIWHYVEILRTGQSPCRRTVRCYEGAKEAALYEKHRQDRLERDIKNAAHQAALAQRIAELGDDNIQTKLPQGISLDLYVRLSRYQGIMGRYCRQLRAMKLIVSWEDSITSFWITACFLSGGLMSLLLPWKFILTWTSRFIVWGLFGPHMKLVDWLLFSKAHDDEAVVERMMNKFHNESQFARIRRQDALKLRDMKCLAFGPYITRVPVGNVCRHYDRPLPESFAQVTKNAKPIERKIAAQCIPGQQYYGNILPRTERDMIQFEKEMKELQPVYDALCHTAKLLHDSEMNERIQRLKSQSSINEEIPESEGYELVSYDHNRNLSNKKNDDDDHRSGDESHHQETRLQLGNGSTLSLNLKSSQIAIMHHENNEGSRRRRSSTFRGGYEMLPVIRMDDDEDDDDDHDNIDQRQSRRNHQQRSSSKNVKIQLGSSSYNRVVLDSEERVAILDTKLHQEINITTTTISRTITATNDLSVPKRSYQMVDPLQKLAKRSVCSITCDIDEQRESGDIEIVLCPATIREESVALDANYETTHDGDMQVVTGGYDKTTDDEVGQLTVGTSTNQSCVVYFQPS